MDDSFGTNDWSKKSSSLRSQLEAITNIELPQDGFKRTILEQLNRGDLYPDARYKAWNHILSELKFAKETLGVDIFMELGFIGSCCVDGGGSTREEGVVENTTPVVARQDVETMDTPSVVLKSGAGTASTVNETTRANSAQGRRQEVTKKSTAKRQSNNNKEPNKNSHENITSNRHAVIAKEEPKPQTSKLIPAPISIPDEQRSDTIPNHDDTSENKDNPHAITIRKLEEKKDLSMLERQELWLARKALKVETQKKAAKAAEENSLKSAPDMRRSRISYGNVRAKISKEKMDTLQSYQALMNVTNDATSGGRRKHRKSAPVGFKQKKSLASNKSKNKSKKSTASAGGLIQELDTQIFVKKQKQQNENNPPPQEQIEKANEADASTNSITNNRAPITDPPHPTPPSVPKVAGPSSSSQDGSFFTRIDNGRGILQVREGSNFQINSLYRKRDRRSGHGSAIAMLVGKTENCPLAEEKVIEVTFDTDKLPEDVARDWWENNKQRFDSPEKGEGAGSGDIEIGVAFSPSSA